MPHVEVDHVLGVGPLNGDGEGFERVEGEGDQAPYCVVNGPSQQACLDLKLQQPRVPRIKPGMGKERRENSTIKLFICNSLLVSECLCSNN